MKNVGRYGIVTAISHNMWDDYLLFHTSLMRTNSFPLRVVGFGLNRNQKEFIGRQQNTTLIELPLDLIEHLSTIDAEWRKWYKPLFFKKAVVGFDTAIWLDTDLVITGKLDPLFTRAQEGFFVLQDYFAPQYCPNKPDLYTYYSLPQPVDNRILNSGVWGGLYPRDNNIIDRWIKNVEDAHNHKVVYDNVTLHDQGTLLLALHQIGSVNSILNIKKWNYPARRLLYDNTTDLIDAVVADHPEALIVHYAGLPKLPHLQTVGHPKSAYYFKNRCGAFTTKKEFVTGSEQFLSPAAMSMRHGARAGGWFKYSEMPLYADYMNKKLAGEPITLDQNLTHYFSRSECPYSCTFSPHFGPLFSDFATYWPHADYTVILGDPIDSIRHKLHHYRVWPQKLGDTPGLYQSMYGEVVRANQSLNYLNRKRIVIDNNSSLIKACTDEIVWHLGHALEFVNSNHNGRILWATSSLDAITQLTENVDQKIFDRSWPKLTEPRLADEFVDEWIDGYLHANKQFIIDQFFGLLTKHRVSQFTLIP